MSNEMMDFDLDTNIGDIGDLVSYTNPADGTHIYGLVYCNMDYTYGDDPVKCVTMVYQKLGTVELEDPDAMDAPTGSIWKESFTGNKMGQELLKLRLRQIFGDEIVDKAEKEKQPIGILVRQLDQLRMSEWYLQIVIKIKKSKSKKKGDDTVYENIRVLGIDLVGKDSVTLPEGFEQFEYSPREIEED